MQQLKVLSKKETEAVIDLIEKQWGVRAPLPYVFLKSSQDNLYVATRDMTRIDLSTLRVNNLGLYFGELSHGELRLSIEGSQLVGPHATKHLIELSKDEQRAWLRGEDIERPDTADDFLIVRRGEDYMGCGKMRHGKLLNHVPKVRRLKSQD